MQPLRIAQVAPPIERVPPIGYGGTERIVDELVRELTRRGHEVTTFASGDSEVPGRLVPTVDRALRPAGFSGDPTPYLVRTQLEVLARAGEFDLVHSHLEWASIPLARLLPLPVVITFHGRLDGPVAHEILRHAPGTIVAISHAQAATHPDLAWAAVIHHGLSLADAPPDEPRREDLCFVGRVAPEKGIVDAMEVARRSGRRLRIAAKVGTTQPEREYYEAIFVPALQRAGSSVEFVGELGREERDRLLAGSFATVIPAAWPEPFGLVTIESLACGTPVLARRVGALPEVVREGVDGFFGDDVQHLAYLVDRVGTLDRAEIRRSTLQRFSPERMVDEYEALYERVLSGDLAGPQADPASVTVRACRAANPAGPSGSPAHRTGPPQGTAAVDMRMQCRWTPRADRVRPTVG